MLIQSTALIVILLQLGARRGCTQQQRDDHLEHDELDDDYYRDICEMQESFRSPFVRAFYEEETRQTEGCREEEEEEEEDGDDISIRPAAAASLAQEIHVIQVTTPLGWRPSPTAGSRDLNQTAAATRINLQIKSEQESSAGSLTKKLTFVLVSNVSIRWKVQLEGIDVSSELQFWVTNGSRVSLDRRLNMKVHQLKQFSSSSSSSSSGALFDWISQKLGPVTTRVEVKPTRSIVHVVGIADLAKVCEEETAPEKTEEEIGGCLLRSSNGQRSKDVHILELEGNSPAAAADPRMGVGGGQRSVTVELHPRSNSRPLLRRHLMLVLKSQHPTRWKVQTAGLRGTLDIVTDSFVDTGGVMMQTVGVVSERLSQLSGTDLVAWTSEKYGEPISYAFSRTANRFDLTVDGIDEADVDSDLKPKVICNPNSITIGLRKRSLTNRFVAAHLSLSDRSCRVKQNATHYFWTTPLTACGTVRTLQNDRITYRNAVVIHNRRPSNGPLSDHSGSGFEPRVDDENSDSEKSSSEVRLDFHCTYPSEEVKYALKLYKDPEFQLEMLNFPVTVSDKEMLYVEASANQDSVIGLVINSCTVLSSSLDQPGYQLIRNGCSMEERVSWLGSGVSPRIRRFQFAFEKSWNGSVVRCQLSSCVPGFTADSSTQIQKCPPPDLRCSASHADKGLSLSNAFSKSTSIGPIVLQEKHLAGTTFALQDSSTQFTMAMRDEVQFDCDRVNHIEGLDSAAVVGIAFAAFAIGVLLTGALWFIHSHTGSVKKHTKGIRSAEASGESTPSSTAPMAIHPRHHRV